MKITTLSLLLIAAPILLTGCGKEMPHEWQPHDPAVQTQAVQENLVFSKGQTKVSDGHIQQLKNLTHSYGGAAPSSAKIYTHDTADKLKASPLRDRVHSIINCLVKLGVSRNNIEVISDAVAGDDAGMIITVEVEQHVIQSPKCNGWNYSMDRFLRPEGEMDFGCTTAANLSAMVANPSDLIQGQTLDKGDAQRSDLFVDLYRTDKKKDLIKEDKILKTS